MRSSQQEREREARGLHVPGEPLNPQRPVSKPSSKPAKSGPHPSSRKRRREEQRRTESPGLQQVASPPPQQSGASADAVEGSGRSDGGGAEGTSGGDDGDGDGGGEGAGGGGGEGGDGWVDLSALAASGRHVPGSRQEKAQLAADSKAQLAAIAASVAEARKRLQSSAPELPPEERRAPVGFKVKAAAGSRLRSDRRGVPIVGGAQPASSADVPATADSAAAASSNPPLPFGKAAEPAAAPAEAAAESAAPAPEAGAQPEGAQSLLAPSIVREAELRALALRNAAAKTGSSNGAR